MELNSESQMAENRFIFWITFILDGKFFVIRMANTHHSFHPSAHPVTALSITQLTECEKCEMATFS